MSLNVTDALSKWGGLSKAQAKSLFQGSGKGSAGVAFIPYGRNAAFYQRYHSGGDGYLKCYRLVQLFCCVLPRNIFKKLFYRIIGLVQATVLTRAHGTDIKQMRTLPKLFPTNFENSKHSHLRLSSKHLHEKKPEDSEKKEEFQPCEVSNKTFQHRERIPRTDPCEMCVCVDSEIYCFWKLCTILNLTTVTPPTASIKMQETLKQSVSDNNISLGSTNATVIRENKIETTDEKFSKILKDQRKHNALKKLEATSPKTTDPGNAKTQNVSTSTEKPTICYVMGVMYKYGEILPRDTGTCLECACSDGGRVSCSPKDCVSQPDLDYLSHNNNMDMFELDTF